LILPTENESPSGRDPAGAGQLPAHGPASRRGHGRRSATAPSRPRGCDQTGRTRHHNQEKPRPLAVASAAQVTEFFGRPSRPLSRHLDRNTLSLELPCLGRRRGSPHTHCILARSPTGVVAAPACLRKNLMPEQSIPLGRHAAFRGFADFEAAIESRLPTGDAVKDSAFSSAIRSNCASRSGR